MLTRVPRCDAQCWVNPQSKNGSGSKTGISGRSAVPNHWLSAWCQVARAALDYSSTFSMEFHVCGNGESMFACCSRIIRWNVHSWMLLEIDVATTFRNAASEEEFKIDRTAARSPLVAHALCPSCFESTKAAKQQRLSLAAKLMMKCSIAIHVHWSSERKEGARVLNVNVICTQAARCVKKGPLPKITSGYRWMWPTKELVKI